MKSEVIKLIEGREDVTLTTYVLDASAEIPGSNCRPAVIICPGGGYFSCSDREAEPIAMAFAMMGYHTFVLRYSVYNENVFEYGLNNIQPKEDCRYPKPMLDVARAMLCVRDHAKEWKVETERIVLCGFSAGGHNAAMYITNWDKPVITEYFNRPAADFKPAAAIVGYPLTDYLFAKENLKSAHPMDQEFFRASNIAYLGTAEPEDELLRTVSPARNVTDQVPPVYIWATASDALVPVQHSVLLANALAEAHVPFELHIFEQGMHGLSTATQTAAMARTQVMPDVAQWVPLCNTWLLKHFAYDLPEKDRISEMIETQMNNQ